MLCPEVRGAVESTPMKPLELVKQYHEQTKHEFNRYARALGYMDWANQPDPFRRYEGTPLYELPLLAAGDEPVAPSYESLFASQPVPPQPLGLNSLARFFEYGLSLTAWKEYGGNRWALRSNPSSGNLHPTEGYLLIRGHRRSSVEAGALSLCCQRTRVGAPGAWYERGDRGTPSPLSHAILFRRAKLDPLAGSVEVWGTRVSLLPARRRPRAGHASDCGSRPRLASLSSCRAR